MRSQHVEIMLVILILAVFLDIFKGWVFPTLKHLIGFLAAISYAVWVSGGDNG